MTKSKLLLYIFFCFIGISCTKNDSEKIVIATSSNFQFVINELIESFKNDHKANFEVILGASGKLTAQIENGAPFNIFLSAHKKYTDYLIQKKIGAQQPITFAYGNIALASLTIASDKLMDTLNANTKSKIAVANPKFAPYGEMSVEFLKNKKLYDTLKNRLVYGESIMQTNQFLNTKAVDLAFTSLSTVKHKKNINYIALSTNLYNSQPHTALVISSTKKEKEFIEFLVSEKAQSILKKNGYGTIK